MSTSHIWSAATRRRFEGRTPVRPTDASRERAAGSARPQRRQTATLQNFLLVLGLFFSGSLFAQAPQTLPERVSVRVLALDGMITDLAVQSSGKRSQLIARSTAFSVPVEAQVTKGIVTFYRHPSPPAPTPTTPGTPPVPEPPAASFAVQPGTNFWLVVVSARGTGENRTFQVYAIPDSAEALPLRHARVINFTDAPLAVRLGSGTQVVGAAQSAVMACAPEPDGHAALQLAISSEASGGQWQLARSTRVAVPENRRLLVLITPEARHTDSEVAQGSILNIKTILDGPPSQSGGQPLASRP